MQTFANPRFRHETCTILAHNPLNLKEGVLLAKKVCISGSICWRVLLTHTHGTLRTSLLTQKPQILALEHSAGSASSSHLSLLTAPLSHKTDQLRDMWDMCRKQSRCLVAFYKLRNKEAVKPFKSWKSNVGAHATSRNKKLPCS